MNSCFICIWLLLLLLFPLKYLKRVQMCNRCPLLILPCICMHVAAAWVWGSLCTLAEQLDGSQFSGGASNEEEGEACKHGCFFHLHYLWVSGGCSLTYWPSVSFISKEHKVPTDTSAWTWRHNGIPHKGFWAFTVSLRGYYKPTGFLIWFGQEAAYQGLKLVGK